MGMSLDDMCLFWSYPKLNKGACVFTVCTEAHLKRKLTLKSGQYNFGNARISKMPVIAQAPKSR